MSWVAVVRIAVRALCRNKLRSVLTMLGIIIGVSAVITMVAVGAGAQAQLDEQIKSLGSALIMVYPGSYSSVGVKMGAGTRAALTEDDAVAIQQELPDVYTAAPMLRGNGQVVFAGKNWSTPFYGVTPEFFEARQWEVSSGRLLEPADVTAASKVVMVGESVARTLFGDEDAIEQVIRVHKVPMVVIGILAKKGQTLYGQDQDDMIVMPISTMRKRVWGGSQAKLRLVSSVLVKIREGTDMTQAESEIRMLLRQRHRLQPAQEDDFSVRNLSEVLDVREESTKIMTLLLAAVACVSLLVGGIGIMNIMLVSVTERTREIGLRMAVGARRRDILSQFLVEAVTLATAGGLCGVIIGLGASYGISHFGGWRMVLHIDAIIVAIGFAVAVGVFFGFYPARRASRLLPIDALHYE